MKPFLIEYMPWLISASTVLQVYMAGSMHRHAWTFSMFCQLLWTIWIVLSATWGLLPLTVMLWIISIRNHMIWRKELPAK